MGNDSTQDLAMVAFFEWDAKYNLGVRTMDDEHQLIVGAMNQLHALQESRISGPPLLNAMSRLMQVTRRHFADEEGYMESIGYPGLRKHQLMHVHLLERLAQYEAEMKKSGSPPADLFDFLKMWLKAHICGIDTQYAKHGKVA